MASAEHRTILICWRKVKLTLKDDPDLALFLFQNQFVKKHVYEEISNPRSMLTAEQKAEKLLAAVYDSVELNPQLFHVLVNQLRKNHWYTYVVGVLDTEFGKLCK